MTISRGTIDNSFFVSKFEPKIVKEALTDEFWINAMQDELAQFKRNEVWELVPRPEGTNIIGTKWIYKNKSDEQGVITRNKARLVAQARQQNNNNQFQRFPNFDLVLMPYTELFSALLSKGNIHTRSPPVIPKDLPYWFKVDQLCPYHQGAPGHNIENSYGFKADIHRLVRSGMLSFKDTNPNVQTNLLPQHGNVSVNMVYGCPGEYRINNVLHMRGDLV
ncbi:uncharacterized protein LOC131618801 [Vicia villosa]|uniref:uncharacterized protein LOC131618801 n=1 Tax=Vicia villosa TaxID=3911 RepID=UPI00273AE9F9|nr:uncharacterized protein LOC131618801 [Vicia villosa]